MRKRRRESRQVSFEKMSASEPSMTHRNGLQTLSKRVWDNGTRISMGDTCLRPMRQPVHRRHDLTTGFNTERGNLTQSAKGNQRMATTMSENTNICGRGGAARSSAETTVMVVERRGCVILLETLRQPIKSGGTP